MEERDKTELKHYQFTVWGHPIPAVRMTGKTKFINKYARRYLEYKNMVGTEAIRAGIKKIYGEVLIEIKAYVASINTGDWDNIGKSICDALNGIAYKDDRRIVSGKVEKVFVEDEKEERVEVLIKEIPNIFPANYKIKFKENNSGEWIGKKNKYIVIIKQYGPKQFGFMITCPNGLVYNTATNCVFFNTYEDACFEAEDWINEHRKISKPSP